MHVSKNVMSREKQEKSVFSVFLIFLNFKHCVHAKINYLHVAYSFFVHLWSCKYCFLLCLGVGVVVFDS